MLSYDIHVLRVKDQFGVWSLQQQQNAISHPPSNLLKHIQQNRDNLRRHLPNHVRYILVHVSLDPEPFISAMAFSTSPLSSLCSNASNAEEKACIIIMMMLNIINHQLPKVAWRGLLLSVLLPLRRCISAWNLGNFEVAPADVSAFLMPKEHLSKCCKEECNFVLFAFSVKVIDLKYYNIYFCKSLSAAARYGILRNPKPFIMVKGKLWLTINDALQKQAYSLKCFPTCLFNIRRVYLRIPNRTLNFYNGINLICWEPLQMYLPCGWKITIYFKTTQREVLFTKMYYGFLCDRQSFFVHTKVLSLFFIFQQVTKP